MVALAERLYGKGYNLKIYDQSVREASLIGSNLEFITTRFDHLWKLMQSSAKEVIKRSSVIVLGNRDLRFVEAISRIESDQHVIDLVRMTPERRREQNYAGICW